MAEQTWPAWPECTVDDAETGDDLVQYKKLIVDKYGQEALTRSWLKTCEELEALTAGVSRLGTAAVPVVQFEDLFMISQERKSELKATGCFKVAGVVAKDQATEYTFYPQPLLFAFSNGGTLAPEHTEAESRAEQLVAQLRRGCDR